MAGFASGLVSGLTASNDLQMASLLHAEGEQKLHMNAQQIEMTQRTLDQQKTFMKIMADKLAKLNSGENGPTTQTDVLAQLAEVSAEANFAAGRTEEGLSDATKASTLRSNQAYIDEVKGKVAAEKADYTANLMEWVKEAAADPQEGPRRWNAALASWQLRYGQKSPYAERPYSIQQVDDILAAAQSKGQKAAEDLKIAQKKKDDADLGRIDSENKTAAKRRELLDLQIKALQKSGGLTKAQQAKQEAVEQAKQTAIDRIDRLEALMEEDPNVMGATGFIKRGKEFVWTKLGLEDDTTTASRFKTDMHALLLELPQAMDVKGTRLAAVQRHVDEMANLLQGGTSKETGKAKLEEIRSMLEGKPTKKEGQIKRPAGPAKKYKSADEVKADYEAGNIDGDAALKILKEQFHMED